MLQNGFLGGVLSALPNIKLSDLPKIDVSGGMAGGMTPPSGDPVKKTTPIQQDANQKFGNWTGQADTKVMAQDLMNRGLKGADQLLFENQDTSNADAITNKNQSDWKTSAIQNILANAHKLNIRTPESVDANKNVLIGNGKWADAINNSSFQNIHPNFWQVTQGILKDQWAKEDAQNKNQTAKK
jgi:hypothetical protein